MPLTEEEKKEHNRANYKKWYWSHKEKELARKKKYRKGNKEKEAAYKKKYRQENRDKINKTTRLYCEKNRDRIREIDRRCKCKNRVANNIRQKERRDQLNDCYIRGVLCYKNSLTAKDIPQSLIEAKRLELRAKRYIKEQENG